MILSYNWQIIETLPRSEEELAKIVKIPVPEEQEMFGPESPSNTIQPASLRLPLFGFLFCYYIEEPKNNQPELELVPELTLLEDAIQLRVVKEMRCKNCIFLELLIDSSEIYDILMVLTVRIRYHSGTKPSKIGNIDNLVRLAGHRQLNLYSATTYASIRKEIMVESPVSIEHRFQKQGYLIIRVMRNEDTSEEVEITSVEVMNWLATGNQSIKRDVVLPLLNHPFKLLGKETYAVPFKLTSNLLGVQMPIAISYRFPPQQLTFKLVKSIKGQSSE